MTLVGIKVLAGELREYLRLAQSGEKVVVTDQGRPIAVLSGIDDRAVLGAVWDLVESGQARWRGGKPRGPSKPIEIPGTTAASAVLEDRR